MRRSAVLERLVESAELRFELVLAVACDLKGFFHDLDIVVAHRAGGQLYAVAHDVVLIRQNLLGVFVEQRVKTALRHGERIVGEDHLAVVVALIHREVNDEAHLKAAFVDQIKALCDLGTDLTCQLGRFGSAVGDKVDHVACLGAVALDQLFAVTGLEELVNGAVKGQIVVDLDIAETLHADGKREFFHALEPLFALSRRAGNVEGAHALFAEGREVGFLKHVADFLDLERIAQIGLVCAVFQHSFGKRDTPKGRLADFLVAELCEGFVQHLLGNVEHILLSGERHLIIELIEFAGRTVGARVLVAEAGRDLEVSVKTADHQKLLEDLRSLGQSVELALVLAAGDQIVSRALGRGGGEYRSIDLAEAHALHLASEEGNDFGAQQDIVVYLRISQVEEAVFQTNVLACVC